MSLTDAIIQAREETGVYNEPYRCHYLSTRRNRSIQRPIQMPLFKHAKKREYTKLLDLMGVLHRQCKIWELTDMDFQVGLFTNLSSKCTHK